jgi:hypothetical protein
MRRRGVWLPLADRLPVGRLRGCAAPPGTGGKLLDGVESGNYASRRLDLQRGRSLNQGLASPRTNFQTILKVTLIHAQGHRGGVCGDLQHVQ